MNPVWVAPPLRGSGANQRTGAPRANFHDRHLFRYHYCLFHDRYCVGFNRCLAIRRGGGGYDHLALSQGLGSNIGAMIVTVGLLFFAFTTILGWCYYGERCSVYLAGIKGIKIYRLIFIVLVGCGAFIQLST